MRQLKITQQNTVRDTESLSKYLSEISSIENSGGLSAEQECAIAEEIQREGTSEKRKKELIEKLTKGNLRFVISVAKQYQRKSNVALELGDLINAGNRGMIKAAGRFDHTRGFKFISYGVWWIRQSILQEIADNKNTVRMPLNKLGLQNKMNRIAGTLEQHLERKPTDDEIVDALAMEDSSQAHLTGSDVREILTKGQSAFSVDSYVRQDDNDQRFVDSMKSSGLETIESKMQQQDLHLMLNRFMDVLSEREQYVLKSFYGLNGRAKSLEEIGEDVELTRERIRQVKEKAIRKLRIRVKDTTLHEYL